MEYKKIRAASMKIGKVLHDELQDIIDIYPVIAPNKTTGTFGVYRRTGLRVANTKDIYDYEEIASVEIAIISPTYLESVDKATNVKFTLEHLSGQFRTKLNEVLNISTITMTDAAEEWSNDNYIQLLKFDVRLSYDPDVN